MDIQTHMYANTTLLTKVRETAILKDRETMISDKIGDLMLSNFAELQFPLLCFAFTCSDNE